MCSQDRTPDVLPTTTENLFDKARARMYLSGDLGNSLAGGRPRRPHVNAHALSEAFREGACPLRARPTYGQPSSFSPTIVVQRSM